MVLEGRVNSRHDGFRLLMMAWEKRSEEVENIHEKRQIKICRLSCIQTHRLNHIKSSHIQTSVWWKEE
jgi:hypothetical protein